MPIVNMPIQVTQEMLDLYSKGLVSLGPGGFKNLSGRMVQLLKPIAMSGSSAASEALAGVQFGLGVANLGVSIKNGIQINRILKTMMMLKGIAWAGTAVGSVNLVLNVAGMARLSRKIDGLSMRLDQIAAEIKQEMRKIQTEEMIRETKTLIDNFVSVINILENNKLGSNNDITIQDYLNTGKNYINWWVERYKKSRNMESDAIFTLLYDLTTMYAAVVKEYGAQYYYSNGIYPGSYDNWVQSFEYINDKELEKRLKRTIWLSNPVASTERLVDAYDFTLNSIRLQAMDLKEYKEAVPFMPKEAHFDFDAFIKDKIEKGEVEVVEKAESEDPREEVLLQQNGYAAV